MSHTDIWEEGIKKEGRNISIYGFIYRHLCGHGLMEDMESTVGKDEASRHGYREIILGVFFVSDFKVAITAISNIIEVVAIWGVISGANSKSLFLVYRGLLWQKSKTISAISKHKKETPECFTTSVSMFFTISSGDRSSVPTTFKFGRELISEKSFLSVSSRLFHSEASKPGRFFALSYLTSSEAFM